MFRTLYYTRRIYGMGDRSTYIIIRSTAPYSAARRLRLVWGSLTLAQLQLDMGKAFFPSWGRVQHNYIYCNSLITLEHCLHNDERDLTALKLNKLCIM